jgi:hypothetical protein
MAKPLSQIFLWSSCVTEGNDGRALADPVALWVRSISFSLMWLEPGGCLLFKSTTNAAPDTDVGKNGNDFRNARRRGRQEGQNPRYLLVHAAFDSKSVTVSR